ncbi:uncharacterized protein AMSG_00741 [Thecamonas trahens ATCC 50062]|uniref:Uncharacterized protein n=1 Tax=Thecamonas trahens ATCC 50062 TaxID=461836 RepID=A0A0L0DEM2_THETB|nr:hypothetical protein AMSG_00741 [Thecamonas trahens ATCC 50062]KNC50581.1 hypothetical protein AMSG_00741 [Thecamonas trahens ATCC 50062]|eukprot:XP_013762470.1 hypothetical protein AMSG_00741 [Thecamonas trahens ATCC 50062]
MLPSLVSGAYEDSESYSDSDEEVDACGQAEVVEPSPVASGGRSGVSPAQAAQGSKPRLFAVSSTTSVASSTDEASRKRKRVITLALPDPVTGDDPEQPGVGPVAPPPAKKTRPLSGLAALLPPPTRATPVLPKPSSVVTQQAPSPSTARPKRTQAPLPLLPHQMTAAGRANAARVDAAIRAETRGAAAAELSQQPPSDAAAATAAAIAAARARRSGKSVPSAPATSAAPAPTPPKSIAAPAASPFAPRRRKASPYVPPSDFFNLEAPAPVPAPAPAPASVPALAAPTSTSTAGNGLAGVTFVEVAQADLLDTSGYQPQIDALRSLQKRMAAANAAASEVSNEAKSKNHISHMVVQAEATRLRNMHRQAMDAVRR